MSTANWIVDRKDHFEIQVTELDSWLGMLCDIEVVGGIVEIDFYRIDSTSRGHGQAVLKNIAYTLRELPEVRDVKVNGENFAVELTKQAIEADNQGETS